MTDHDSDDSSSAGSAGSERGGGGGGDFQRRHIGPGDRETEVLLAACGYESLDALTEAAVPESIRTRNTLSLPPGRSEQEALADLRAIAERNVVRRSFIGMGYYDCVVPPVIQRNVLENPGWYTQYTPYQAEIAQGRLEGLLTFQTLVCDLTGLPVANASLLDEGTAVAEAMTLCFNVSQRKHRGEDRMVFFLQDGCHPQTVAVVETRAKAIGVEAVCGDSAELSRRLAAGAPENRVFGLVVQYPATTGRIEDHEGIFLRAREAGVMTIAACDPLALVRLRSPGAMGADIAVGSMQRFGVPLGFGGPHAAFFATREEYKRQIPGRIVGVSKDASGKAAFRLSLQTREQHIRRDKATSNICTAQALLANLAAMYAVYHGPEGLCEIAEKVRFLAAAFAEGVRRIAGCRTEAGPFFDTVVFACATEDLEERLAECGMALRGLGDGRYCASFDETCSERDVEILWQAVGGGSGLVVDDVREAAAASVRASWGNGLERSDDILTHEVFHRYRSETEMLRYLRRLESKDLSLTTSMIPLGSCTMKLNATAEMYPVSWREFAGLHPFAAASDTGGYQVLFENLETWLCEITGFHRCSLQPNAGSQGEFAGLMAIASYHRSRDEAKRDVCLIPMSAHGTNPASAVMAGMSVAAVACDESGNIDIDDLRAKAEEHADGLAALMVTYPSTHGVFEEGIREICGIVHAHGGQVYMDGANLNAQVGLCRPGDMGADVCHINLHKTFCIPHGGGGPGMGPICCAEHLSPFLPGHPVIDQEGRTELGPVSAAPWGSSSILPISWMYIAMMGAEGLKRASQVAILNANYIAKRLDSFFPVLYRGGKGLVAHECILDLRRFKTVTVEDVAKRLMDYGFHAPTISWPVAGTMMVEPTESESMAELDRFCDAMILIHGEIEAVESGKIDPVNNPLKNAPHTAQMIVETAWERPYSREAAAFPAPWLKEHKFWPAVGRIDNVYGDRNLLCTCEGMTAFA